MSRRPGGHGERAGAAPVASASGRPRHALVAVLFALLLAGAASGGPDYSRYEDWGLAGLSGSLWEARVYTVSPAGVPLMMWSHGSGFVFATARLVTGGLLGMRSSAMLAGWLAALLLWAAMLRTLWIVARGAWSLVLFGAGLFFLATHGGYFSHVHASESLALACTGILVWLAVEPRRPDWRVFLLAGLTIAFLFTIKPYWVPYGAGTMAVLVLRARRHGCAAGRRIGSMAVAAAPLTVALAQTALTNRWMTGSLLRSPYHFGDAQFTSFDFADPELAAVLLHPWHGLLSYHPFYLLGALAAALIVRGRAPFAVPATGTASRAWAPLDAGAHDDATARRQERPDFSGADMRVLLACGALAILLNLYIQAAWVVWWLGKGTFGMRGMAPAAAIVVPAFIVVAGRLLERGAPLPAAPPSDSGAPPPAILLWGWIGAALACALWSTGLLLTGVEPQFYTWGQLFAGQLATLRGLTASEAAVTGVLWLVLAGLLADTWRGVGAARAGLALAALALIAIAGAYLLGEARWVVSERSAAVLAVATPLAVLAAVVALALRRRLPAWLPEPLTLLLVAAAAAFLIGSTLFFRLAVRVEGDIAAGRRPPHNYAYVNTFSTRDMRESCNEYRHLPAFRDKREAFKAFLIRHGVDAASFPF